jgi:hypothetical protein
LDKPFCIHNNTADIPINRRYEDSEPEDDGLEGSEDEEDEEEEEDEEPEGMSHLLVPHLGDVHPSNTFHRTFRDPVLPNSSV